MFRLFRHLLYRSHSIRQAVGVLFVTVLISNILGLVRNVVIANRVGVTYGSIGPLDNYYAAFVLPDLLYSILIVGALSSAILPLLVKFDENNERARFWQVFNTLLSTGLVALVVGLVLLYFLLPVIMPKLFPGFSADSINTTIQLSQAMLLSPLLFTLSQIGTAALQAKRRFFAPAIAPIVYNAAIIIGALLIPRFGLSVLVVGVVAGALAHFLVQLPSLLRLGWRFRFAVNFKDEHVRHVLKLMIPRTIALTSTQLLLIAFYKIGSTFRNGSIAIYKLTDDLQTAPVLLLANTLAMAILPDFARHFAKNDTASYEDLVGKAIRLLWFIFLPLTLILLQFSRPIIDFYISIGHAIDPAEVDVAVRTFGFFVVSIFFQGSVLLLARAYFARSDTMRPTLYSVASLVVAWLFAKLVVERQGMGVEGLALAFSVGSTINAALLWLGSGLSWRVFMRDSQNHSNFWPVTVCAVTAWLVAIGTRSVFDLFWVSLPEARTALQSVITVGAGFAVSVCVYLAIASVFNLEQWQLIKTRKNSIEK